MCLKKEESVLSEIHQNATQFIHVESGEREVLFYSNDGIKSHTLKDDDFIVIPAGTEHEIKST
jgi:quercetin dioxygenase-like cupin family protein